MKRRINSDRWMLEGFILNVAHSAGQDALRGGEYAVRAQLELSRLFAWFPEQRATLIAEARKGCRHLRGLRIKWAAERAPKLQEAA